MLSFDPEPCEFSMAGVAVLPERAATPPQKKRLPVYPMGEDDLLKRLEKAQGLLRLPCGTWDVLVEIIAPDDCEEQDDGAKQLPAPTDTLPGTDAKIAVLAARVRAGEDLFHPEDASWHDPEAEHLEQVGESLRNGAIKRTKAKVAHRDGASIVIPHVPAEAADTLFRQFRGKDWRELLDALHERDGLTLYRPTPTPPKEIPTKPATLRRLRRGRPKELTTASDKKRPSKETPAVDLSNAVTTPVIPTTVPVAVQEQVETPAVATTVPLPADADAVRNDPEPDAEPMTREQRRAMWADRIARWKASKLTVTEFCRREGCVPDSFHTWKRRLAQELAAQRKAAKEQKAAQHVEQAAAPTVRAERQPTPQPVQQVKTPATVAPVEVVLPCGTVLRVQPGSDLAFIGDLARTLGK